MRVVVRGVVVRGVMVMTVMVTARERRRGGPEHHEQNERQQQQLFHGRNYSGPQTAPVRAKVKRTMPGNSRAPSPL